MRLHVGFMMDPTADRGPDRVPPRSGCGICRGSPAAAPPDGKFPMRPKRVRRACRSMGSGAGEGRPAIKWKAREASATVRMRSSAAPGAYAHAGHASRTLFANATADIFLRSLSNAAISLCRICYCRICLCRICYCRICLCRYYVGHNATAAIFYRRYYCHCSYTHITYS